MIKNLTNNYNCFVQYQEKGEPVTPCMDVYKSEFQYDGSLDRLKLRIVVRVDLQNKDLIGDKWSTTSSMRTLEYFLADDINNKTRVHQLDFIGTLLKEKVKNRVFVKLYRRYADYLQNIQVTLEEP